MTKNKRIFLSKLLAVLCSCLSIGIEQGFLTGVGVFILIINLFPDQFKVKEE